MIDFASPTQSTTPPPVQAGAAVGAMVHSGGGARTPERLVAEIASLSTSRIGEMSRGQLVEIIRTVRGNHLRPGVLEGLSAMDTPTLRRLVLATRRFCQGQSLLGLWGDRPRMETRGGIPR